MSNMLICSFSTSTFLERSKSSLFAEAVQGNEGNESTISRQLEEIRLVPHQRSGSSQEKTREHQQLKLSGNQLQDLREPNLQEVEEAVLQEVQEVHLYKEVQEPEEKVYSNDFEEKGIEEVEQVLLQEVEPVASLQEVVQLPWLAGLTRSRKVVDKLGQEGGILLQEVKPVYKGASPLAVVRKSKPSLFGKRGVRIASNLPNRKLHKKRLEQSSKSRTVKRQSLKSNSEKDNNEEVVPGEVFTVKKLETKFIPAADTKQRQNPRFPSRAVKRSFSSTVDHFQRVRPVFPAGERLKSLDLANSLARLAEDDYKSLLTPNAASGKIPLRYKSNHVESESPGYEAGKGGTQIIITLTNSPSIRLWQATNPDNSGSPPVVSIYPEKEKVDESEDFDVGPVIAAVTAEEDERRVPSRQNAQAPKSQKSRDGSYTKVSVRGSGSSGSLTLPRGPPSPPPRRVPPSPPRVRLYDHPHSDHHRPGECDDAHDAHHHHSDDHRYRNSMPRPVIAAVTAELEEPEDAGPAPPSPPPPGPPAPPPTQRPIATERPVLPSVVGPTYGPPTSYLPPPRPAPPPRPTYQRPKPTTTALGSSYGPPNRPSPAAASPPLTQSNPSSPSNSLASSNHYHIHVTSPRQLTQVLHNTRIEFYIAIQGLFLGNLI